MYVIFWVMLLLLNGNLGIMGWLFSSSNPEQESVIEDLNMNTRAYHTEIQVQPDNSYLVSENIEVTFYTDRHGIYRYVPQKGIITEMNEDGSLTDIPYYARFDAEQTAASTTLKVSSNNGNKVFQLGNAESTVYGDRDYSLQYYVTPVTSRGYRQIYYNIFPTGWQNEIPSGSSFRITFPGEIDTEALQLYYGQYGERMDGNSIVSLTWNGNSVSGELKEALPTGTGLSFYVPVSSDYFTEVHTFIPENRILTAIAVSVFLLLMVLFFVFGRDRQIIPSIQFRPPAALDSAAVGYIVDGNVSDTDVISLLIFWADKGYIKIRENAKSKMYFTKLQELPDHVPEYEKTLFSAIFGKYSPIGENVFVSSLQYKTASSFAKTKEQIKAAYSERVYTKSSRAARVAGTVLCAVPLFSLTIYLVIYTMTNWFIFVLPVLYLTGVILFQRTVDYWYSQAKSPRMVLGSVSVALSVTAVTAYAFVYGSRMLQDQMISFFLALLAAAVSSLAGIILTGFMKKRTDECVEWMGYLAGLRDFIETAELERMRVIAKETPHLFYHILPYAYVFGLTDLLLEKMKNLALPGPEWFESPNSRLSVFDYYLLHRILHTDMRTVTATIATPRPVPSSKGSSGGFGGGSPGGGGFSGGGFGGGGGGSW